MGARNSYMPSLPMPYTLSCFTFLPTVPRALVTSARASTTSRSELSPALNMSSATARFLRAMSRSEVAAVVWFCTSAISPDLMTASSWPLVTLSPSCTLSFSTTPPTNGYTFTVLSPLAVISPVSTSSSCTGRRRTVSSTICCIMVSESRNPSFFSSLTSALEQLARATAASRPRKMRFIRIGWFVERAPCGAPPQPRARIVAAD